MNTLLKMVLLRHDKKIILIILVLILSLTTVLFTVACNLNGNGNENYTHYQNGNTNSSDYTNSNENYKYGEVDLTDLERFELVLKLIEEAGLGQYRVCLLFWNDGSIIDIYQDGILYNPDIGVSTRIADFSIPQENYFHYFSMGLFSNQADLDTWKIWLEEYGGGTSHGYLYISGLIVFRQFYGREFVQIAYDAIGGVRMFY